MNSNQDDLPLNHEPSIVITSDISSKKWLNVIRRMQSVAKTEGRAAISITVFVDADGTPLLWLNPVVRKFEPKGDIASFHKLMNSIFGNVDE